MDDSDILVFQVSDDYYKDSTLKDIEKTLRDQLNDICVKNQLLLLYKVNFCGIIKRKM